VETETGKAKPTSPVATAHPEHNSSAEVPEAAEVSSYASAHPERLAQTT